MDVYNSDGISEDDDLLYITLNQLLEKYIREKRKFSEIKKILDKYQLTDKALELIRYKIIWNGLIPLKIIETN